MNCVCEYLARSGGIPWAQALLAWLPREFYPALWGELYSPTGCFKTKSANLRLLPDSTLKSGCECHRFSQSWHLQQALLHLSHKS